MMRTALIFSPFLIGAQSIMPANPPDDEPGLIRYVMPPAQFGGYSLQEWNEWMMSWSDHRWSIWAAAYPAAG